MEKRTLSITGEASCFMKPDMCNISFTVNKYSVDYSECVNELNEEISEILAKLKKIKIDKNSLTTKDFNINPHSVYDEDLKEYVFIEYIGEHKIDINIDNDSKVINKVLGMLNENEFTPKVSIYFGLKDENIIKEKALEMAINKAKRNAEIISKNLQVKLVNILDIKYNFEENFTTRRRYEYLDDMSICDSSCEFNIMPQDTKHSESVSVVWEIM